MSCLTGAGLKSAARRNLRRNRCRFGRFSTKAARKTESELLGHAFISGSSFRKETAKSWVSVWICLAFLALGWAAGSAELSPGLVYKNDRVRSAPWSIHLLQIDRSRADFKFLPTLGQHEVLGLSELT